MRRSDFIETSMHDDTRLVDVDFVRSNKQPPAKRLLLD